MNQKQNPYLKPRNSQSTESDAPVIARLPQHFFTSAEAMHKELYPYEACIALIPNTNKEFPYKFHAAFAYKDGAKKVYTMSLVQHHGDPHADAGEAIKKIVKKANNHPQKFKKSKKGKRYNAKKQK